MTEILYTQSRRHPMAEGRTRLNPRFFVSSEDGATKVLLDGDHPRIAKAYERAGVEVSRVDALAVNGSAADLPAHEPSAVIIPDDWQDLPWTQKSGEGATLRSLASAISNEPVTSKAQAAAVIEAELQRRAG